MPAFGDYAFKNVKDFGATGDGSTDDRAALQSALDWTTGHRGTLFFPPGIYKITSALTYNDITGDNQLNLVGSGMASVIQGSYDGWLFDREAVGGSANMLDMTIEKLWFDNSHAAGKALRIQRGIGVRILWCRITAGLTGLDCYTDCYNLVSLGSQYWMTGVSYNTLATGIIGTHNACFLSGLDVVGWGDGVRLATSGTVLGSRFEANGRGVMCGKDNAGGTLPCNAIIKGCSFEGNQVGVYGNSLNNSVIEGISVQGQDFGAQGNSTYGIFVVNSENTRFANISLGDHFETAVIGFTAGNVPKRTVFENVVPSVDTGGAVLWALPSNPIGLTFRNCQGLTAADLECTVAELTALEATHAYNLGDERFISDANSATAGAALVGGSTNHVWAKKGRAGWFVGGVT